MKKTFPKNFIFGVADADLQVIGEDNTRKEEGSERTMWDEFAVLGRTHESKTPGMGNDRYHKWREDIEIMKKMGVKHYRTSISMSRTLKRNGEINTKAIEWYKAYFKSLKKEGILIYATLYHWELPQHLQEKGGWEKEIAGEYFLKHARAVAENLGEYIEEYFILNEPWCVSLLSNFLGWHAPGNKDLKKALLVAHNLLLAQGRVYESLRSISKTSKISTVFNVEPSYAISTDPKDLLAAKYADGSFNRWFYDALFKGKYPEDMVELYGENMPVISEGDMKTIQIGAKLHAIGMNYYRGNIVRYNPEKELKFDPDEYALLPNSKTNGLGWAIFEPPLYPEGLYDILNQTYNAYRDYGLKRIYIAENGSAWKSEWDGKSTIIADPGRVAYYKEHIGQVYKALIHGVPVEGYFAWTFMDNYEWAEGYRPESRFGLIYVDWSSMKRIWKESAYWYKKLIKTRTLEI